MSEVPLEDLARCRVHSVGVPRSQDTALPQNPTGGLCLGPHGSPGGGAVSYERGAHV